MAVGRRVGVGELAALAVLAVFAEVSAFVAIVEWPELEDGKFELQ